MTRTRVTGDFGVANVAAMHVRPDALVDGATAAHRCVVATLEHDDWDPRAPSLLPGWSIGHVVTHIARNADAIRGLYEAAERGEVGDMYPGGREQRAADIETGAARARDGLIDDVRSACAALEAAWQSTSDATWSTGVGRSLVAPLELSEWPYPRWRETEVHHVDLGLSFTVDDWSDGFVRREWRNCVASLAERLGGRGCVLTPHDCEPAEIAGGGPAVRGAQRELLGWMLSRATIEGAPALEPWG
jgi:maleylpyruvate isomerase